MITIKLEIASNGVIKTVTDNNYNGAGSKHESKTVYSTEDDPGFEQRIKFLYEICDDLGVNLGNKFDAETLDFEINWGSHYEPTLDQVKRLIKDSQKNLKELKEWKAELEQNIKADELLGDLIPNKDVPF